MLLYTRTPTPLKPTSSLSTAQQSPLKKILTGKEDRFLICRLRSPKPVWLLPCSAAPYFWDRFAFFWAFARYGRLSGGGVGFLAFVFVFISYISPHLHLFYFSISCCDKQHQQSPCTNPQHLYLFYFSISMYIFGYYTLAFIYTHIKQKVNKITKGVFYIIILLIYVVFPYSNDNIKLLVVF
jgi:hypothetical protein